MLTQYPSHGALYVRSHDTYMCFYMYGSPNKNVVIVPCSARSEAQDRNNVASNFEEIWMLSGKNTGLIASIIKEYQNISQIFSQVFVYEIKSFRSSLGDASSGWSMVFGAIYPEATPSNFIHSPWFWSMIFPKTTLSNVKTSWQSFWFLAHTLHNPIQLNRYSQKHFSTIFLY